MSYHTKHTQAPIGEPKMMNEKKMSFLNSNHTREGMTMKRFHESRMGERVGFSKVISLFFIMLSIILFPAKAEEPIEDKYNGCAYELTGYCDSDAAFSFDQLPKDDNKGNLIAGDYESKYCEKYWNLESALGTDSEGNKGTCCEKPKCNIRIEELKTGDNGTTYRKWTGWRKVSGCPDSLPVKKGQVALKMFLGTYSSGEEWVPAIGFSKGVRINYLDKLFLSLDAEHQGMLDKSTSLHYHLDGAWGTTLEDLSGKETHGALLGDAAFTAEGQFDGALVLDGNGDYGEVGDTSSLEITSGDFTMEAWIKLPTLSGVHPLITKISATEKSYALMIEDGLPVLYLSSDGMNWTELRASGIDGILADTWVHIAAVRNGDAITVYLDGEEVATGVFAESIFDSTASVKIGSDGTNYLQGMVDEVRISSVAQYQAAPFEVQEEAYIGWRADERALWYTHTTGIVDLVQYLNTAPIFHYTTEDGEEKWLAVRTGQWADLWIKYYSIGEKEYLTLNHVAGNKVTFEAAEDGTKGGKSFRAIERQNPSGTTIRIAYHLDEGDKGVTIFDGMGNPHDIILNEDLSISSITVAGKTWSYNVSDFSEDGYSVAETSPSGHTTEYFHTKDRVLTKQLDYGAAGDTQSIEYFYDSLTSILTKQVVVCKGDTRITTYDFDEDTGRTSIFWPDGTVSYEYTVGNDHIYETGTGAQVIYSYADNKLSSITDANGNVTQYFYDDRDRRTKVLRHFGDLATSTEAYYDTFGNVTKNVSPSGVTEYYYNAVHQLTKDVRNGEATEYYLDPAGQKTKVVNALGYVQLYWYNDLGKVTKRKGPFDPAVGEPGTSVTDFYDNWGNRTKHVNELLAETTYLYDGDNRVTKTIGALGYSTQYFFDWRCKKTKQIDAGNAETVWMYDGFGQCTKITGSSASGGGCGGCGCASGAGGMPGEYYYNLVGRLTKYRDLAGNETVYAYDAAWRKTAVTDARAYKMAYEYDPNGNVTKQIDPNLKETTYAYDGMNRLIAIGTAAGTTEHLYDLAGRLTKMIDWVGAERISLYDADGKLTKSIGTLGDSTTYEYDVIGRQTKVTNPDNSTVVYFYDPSGRVTKTQDALSGESVSYYDAAGRLTKSVDIAGGETTYLYDATGRMTKTIDASGGETSYAYDPNGRRTKVIDPVGNEQTWEYNGYGKVTKTTNGAGEFAAMYYDLVQRVIKTVDARNLETTYVYDETGNRIRTTVGGVIDTSQVVDGMGNVLSTIGAAGNTTSYEYDNLNRVTKVTNAVGEETVYAYDAAGRRTLVTMPGGGTRSYFYNIAGQLTKTAGGPEGETTYAYDIMGRQTRVTDANTRARDTYYDILGRVTKVENEMDQPVTYAYDAAGRRTSLADAKGNATAYDYDVAGRLTKMTYANGNSETYAYDNAGRLLTKYTCNYHAGDTAASIAYAYDGAGRLSTVTTADGVVTYNRLGGVVTSITGPRTTMSYEYDALGRMTAVTDSALGKTVGYAYDARGLRTKLSAPNGTDVSYQYDNALRLTAVIKDTDAPASYAYDAAGRRTKLTLPNGVYTEYVYDSADRLVRLATKDNTGTVLASFDYTLDNVGNRTAIAYADGSVSQYAFDQAYRLTEELRLTGAAGDTLYAQTFEYDAVGNRTKRWSLMSEGTSGTTGGTGAIGDSGGCEELGGWWSFAGGGSGFAVPTAAFATDSSSITGALLHCEDGGASFGVPTEAFTADGGTTTAGLWHFDTGANGFDVPSAGFTTDTDTKALWHCEDATTFADASSNSNDGTMSGSLATTAGSFNNALIFDGTDDFISVADNASLELGSGNWTVEAWVNPASVMAAQRLFCRWGDPGARSYLVYLNDSGKLCVGLSTNGTDGILLESATSLQANTWSHIAVVRSGDAVSVYLNGTCEAVQSMSGSIFDSSASLTIGKQSGASAEYFAGMMDEIRVSGTARYAPAASPDSSGNGNDAILAGGDNGLTMDGKFGSALASACAVVPAGSSLDLGSGNFTLEAWIYPSTTSGVQRIASRWGAYGMQSYMLYLDNGKLGFAASTTGSNSVTLSSDANIAANAWTHVAVVRDDDTVTLYINGQVDEEMSLTGTLYATNADLVVGGENDAAANRFAGKIDEMRLSHVARYISGPTSDASGNSNSAELLGDVQVTANGKFENGYAFNGTNSALKMGDAASLDLSGETWTLEAWVKPSSLSASQCIYSKWGAAGQRSYMLAIENSKLVFRASEDGIESDSVTGETIMTVNAWSHVAVVRRFGQITLYLNGSPDGAMKFDDEVYDSAAALYVGANTGATANFFSGTMDELRVSHTARYQHSTIYDQSGNYNHGLYVGGDAAFTSEARTASAIRLDGSGYVYVPSSPGVDLDDENWTMEAWVKPAAIGTRQHLFDRWGPVGARSYCLYLASNGKLVFDCSTDGTDLVSLTGNATLAANEWAHVATVRRGNKIRLFVNGAQVGNRKFKDEIHDNNGPLKIGGEGATAFAGLMDDARIYRRGPQHHFNWTGSCNGNGNGNGHGNGNCNCCGGDGGTSGEPGDTGNGWIVTTTLYAYNAANQLTAEMAGSMVKTYGYDANGNNLTIVTTDGGSTTGTITMVYDAMNRMTSWSNGTKTESHMYRGNEWHRAGTSTFDGTTTATTAFLYDGDNVLIDYVSGASSSTMTFNKLYVTPFLDQNLSMTIAAGSAGNTSASDVTYYYSQDGLGSVRTLTNATGAKVNQYDYTAFGRKIQTTGTTTDTNVVVPDLPTATTESVSQRYTYTGREQSAYDLAPMYYRYRHYFAGIGRWNARDPIGYEGNPDGSLYAYANNCPNSNNDPMGLLPPCEDCEKIHDDCTRNQNIIYLDKVTVLEDQSNEELDESMKKLDAQRDLDKADAKQIYDKAKKTCKDMYPGKSHSDKSNQQTCKDVAKMAYDTAISLADKAYGAGKITAAQLIKAKFAVKLKMANDDHEKELLKCMTEKEKCLTKRGKDLEECRCELSFDL